MAGEARWSKEAEVAVLGAMLLDPKTSARALEAVDREDFYHEGHARIYAAAESLHERGNDVEVVALAEELKARGELEAAGGMAYLAKLVDAVPGDAGLNGHAKIIREYRALRDLQTAAREANEKAQTAGPGEASALMAEAGEKIREAAERADVGLTDRVFDYADLAADPSLSAPPEPVVPRIAYREHMTLLSSDAKGGKTTLAAAGVAAVANGGRLFGDPVHQGRVLWVKGEGHRRMVVRCLSDFGAEPVPGRIAVVESGHDPVTELEQLVRRMKPDLVVIDTWTSWTAPLELDYWRASDVALPLKRLEAIARSGPAIVLLHHNRRSDGQPRGSGQLMAAMDLLRTLEDGSHDRERKVSGRGRVPCEPFRYTLTQAGSRMCLQLVDPNREIEGQILDYLEAHPDASKRAIREAVDGRNPTIDDAIEKLIKDEFVVRDTSGRAHTHRIAQDPHGHATGTVGHGNGHGGADNEREHRAPAGGVIRSISPAGHGPLDSAGGNE